MKRTLAVATGGILAGTLTAHASSDLHPPHFPWDHAAPWKSFDHAAYVLLRALDEALGGSREANCFPASARCERANASFSIVCLIGSWTRIFWSVDESGT